MAATTPPRDRSHARTPVREPAPPRTREPSPPRAREPSPRPLHTPPLSTSRSESGRVRGTAGEEIAAQHLLCRGLRILDRNWRSGRRELDLVVQEGEVVAFVEVKARGDGPQDPLEALTRSKRRDLRLAAGAWIRAHPGVGREFRFDVVGVRLRPDGPPEIEHVRNAFYGEDA